MQVTTIGTCLTPYHRPHSLTVHIQSLGGRGGAPGSAAVILPAGRRVLTLARRDSRHHIRQSGHLQGGHTPVHHAGVFVFDFDSDVC
jgi:hypothetical protein